MDYLSYDVYKQTKKGFEKLNITPYTVILDPNKPFQLIGTRTLALAVIKIGFEGELLISGFSENREYSNKGELVPCTAVDNDSITIDLNSYRISFQPTEGINISDNDCFETLNVKEVFSCVGFNFIIESEENPEIELTQNPYVSIRNHKIGDSWNPNGFNGIAIINGEQFNLEDGYHVNNGVTYYSTSNGSVYFEPNEEGIVYDVLLKFKESEWLYNDEILEGIGIVDDMNHTIRFLLFREHQE